MAKKYWALLTIAVTFSADVGTIILTTDVPCHLFMRWTLIVPQQHSIPVYRRGIAMHGDKYFCFDTYEDNEQEEAGDTIAHTFIKPDWPVCQTRYFYFHGRIDDDPSPSTTAIFRQHHAVPPVPPVEFMYTFNSIEPQSVDPGLGEAWNTIDLSYEIPPNCSGAIVQIQNVDPSQMRHCGMRKPGSNTEKMGYLTDGNYTWGLVGCNDARQVELFAPLVTNMIYWIMGFTGPNVHFLDTAVEMPLVQQVWNDLDCFPHVPPEADAVIFNVSCLAPAMGIYAIRKKGSTDVHYAYFLQNFPILGIDGDGKAQIWPRAVGGNNVHCFLTGYIVGGIKMHTNSIDISPAILDSWQSHPISAYNATTHYAIIETSGAASPLPWGVRKGGSVRPILGTIRDHQWCYPHCNRDRNIDLYRSVDTMHFYEIGVTD